MGCRPSYGTGGATVAAAKGESKMIALLAGIGWFLIFVSLAGILYELVKETER